MSSSRSKNINSNDDEWKIVVEETLNLLKKEQIPQAIGLLEALLENHKQKVKLSKKSSDSSSCTGKSFEKNIPSSSNKVKKSRSSKRRNTVTDVSEHETSKRQLKLKTRKQSTNSIQESKKDNKITDNKTNDNKEKDKNDNKHNKDIEKKDTNNNVIKKTDNIKNESIKKSDNSNSVKRSEKQEKGWGFVVNELYSTERDYIRDLQTIIDVFKTPLLSKNIISNEEANKLFSNIEMILTVNGELLKQLESIESTKSNDKSQSKGKVPDSPSIMSKHNIDMKVVTAVMKINVKETDGAYSSKTLSINGLTTFREAEIRLKRKLPQDQIDSYQLYHGNDLIEDLDQGILRYVEYNKLKLKFTYKKDALKGVQSVGGAILNMAHYLKIYSEYCSNQMNALYLLNDLKDNREGFDTYLKSCFKDKRTRRLDLNSFLVLPLQRVCKYPLLLRELLSQTPEGHPDYTPLTQASALIGSTVITINEKKREAEEQQVMINLQNSIDGMRKGDTVIAPARRFIKKGKISYVGKKDTEPAEYFLFSDIFLVVTPKDEDGRYQFLDSINIKNGYLTDTEDDINGFSIGRFRKPQKVVLICKNEREKKKLKEIIQKQILKDTFEDWQTAQTSIGNNTNITFTEWFDLYGKTLVG